MIKIIAKAKSWFFTIHKRKWKYLSNKNLWTICLKLWILWVLWNQYHKTQRKYRESRDFMEFQMRQNVQKSTIDTKKSQFYVYWTVDNPFFEVHIFSHDKLNFCNRYFWAMIFCILFKKNTFVLLSDEIDTFLKIYLIFTKKCQQKIQFFLRFNKFIFLLKEVGIHFHRQSILLELIFLRYQYKNMHHFVLKLKFN